MKVSFPLKKKYRWLLILAGSAVIIFISATLLSLYIKNKVRDKIQALHIATSGVDISIVSRSIKVSDIKWSSMPDSINDNFNLHSASLGTVTISGIHLFDLLVHRNFVVDELAIANGNIQYNTSFLEKNKKQTDLAYRSFFIKRLSLASIDLLIKTDTVVNLSAKLGCTITNIDLKIDSTRGLIYSLKKVELSAKHIMLNKNKAMYHGTIASVYCNTEEQRMVIDSAELVPNFSKYEFAHRFGKQTDRITAFIPKLIAEGLKYNQLLDSTFAVSKIQLKSFHVLAFRDKRVPTRYEPYTPLPMENFLKFPWNVNIDSVVITNSMVVVEEIPEKSIKSSIITFEDINASLTGFNNQKVGKAHDYALLRASGLLMGVGKINAVFRLPLDGKSVYNAKGSVSKMPFSKLNPALVPLANVKIESGYLNELSFDFNYTDFTSKGWVKLEYQDLHLVSLGKDHRSTNEIRTLLLNALVKNNITKSLASFKRTGEIDIQRDRKRFIFNSWWKSISDGLKSIFLRKGKRNKTKIK